MIAYQFSQIDTFIPRNLHNYNRLYDRGTQPPQHSPHRHLADIGTRSAIHAPRGPSAASADSWPRTCDTSCPISSRHPICSAIVPRTRRIRVARTKRRSRKIDLSRSRPHNCQHHQKLDAAETVGGDGGCDTREPGGSPCQ